MNQFAQSAKFSDQLATVPDQMLPRLAQQYKSDAITLSLILGEKNRRERTRGAATAQQAAQPQPKVNDAVVAEMMQELPENVGIGQLPTPNMDQMYDGGIVAFAGGGKTSWEEELERLQAPPQESSALGRSIANAFTYSSDFEALLQNAKAKQAAGIPLTVAETQALQSLASPTPETSKKPSPLEQERARNMAQVANEGYTRGDPRALPNMPSIQEQLNGAAPTADTTRRAAPISDAPVSRAPSAPAVPAQTAAQRYATMQKGSAPDREKIDAGIAALGERMRATAKGELEDADKEAAERGEAFKGREERLAKREAGMGKQKDELMGLSLLEAGLAIMSTPGSLATAIGKGAQSGLKTYSAGLKDLRAAQEKMDDARDQIEEFRRNEANMTAKERRQYKAAINRTEIEIEKLGLNAAEKMYGYGREDAKTIFQAETQERLTDKEIAGRKEAARISASQPNAQMQIAMALGGGDLETGLRKVAEIQAGKFSVSNSYADYLKAFAGKDTLTPPLSFANYAAQFGATLPR